MMAENPLIVLGRLGQSPWYDYITRELIASGRLARLIAEDGLRGMTSNPTIFQKAVASGTDYDDDIRQAASEGRSPAEIFETLSVADVRAACDVFRPLYDATAGADGLVSIEVSPEVAQDTAATLAMARRLWALVDRPNTMIKIPGTRAGLSAITEGLAAGININITLLFSVDRYREVIAAFQEGLTRRVANGLPVDRIASVASFFVSRVDARVDPLLDQSGDPARLRGTIAIANAAAAYEVFERSLETPAWKALAVKGARPQRPLWASTSTKDPRYPDTYYVEALVASRTVNTMPPETLDAYRDHGKPEIRIGRAIAEAPARLAALAGSGIDLAEVTRFLEEDGVRKFADSYRQLLAGIEAKIGALAAH
jgi:transaldolase